MLAFLQMRSQLYIALGVAAAGLGCGHPAILPGNAASKPVDAPDLTLARVAFARLSEGRVVARGTASSLEYRRQGGALAASDGRVTLEPDSGTRLASFGTLHLTAPRIEGDITGKRGTGQGGVELQAAHGDHARTARVAYDGSTLRSDDPVDASGPGYTVHGQGLVARTDGSSIRLVHGVHGALDVGAAP